MAFGLLGLSMLVLRAAVPQYIVIVTIYLQLRRLRLLLVTFRGWPFRFLVASIVINFVPPLTSLPLGRIILVQLSSWLTISTGVIEICSRGVGHPTRIEAFNMLPCVARLAVNRVSIVVRKVADALDGVRLFIYGLGEGGRIVSGNGRS